MNDVLIPNIYRASRTVFAFADAFTTILTHDQSTGGIRVQINTLMGSIRRRYDFVFTTEDTFEMIRNEMEWTVYGTV